MMSGWSRVFFRGVIVLIGIGVLGLLIGEPQIEGRNEHATQFQIYFQDPFLAYAYLASAPFFVALVHAYRGVGYVGRGEVPAALKSLRIIRRCAITLAVFVAGGLVYILLSDSDDRAGGVFVGVIIALGSIGAAVTATRFERIARARGHIL